MIADMFGSAPLWRSVSEPRAPVLASKHSDEGTLVSEAFEKMIAMCVPPKTYGQVRINLAAHRLFIAAAYVVCPEVFEGQNISSMAQRVGCSARAFKCLCEGTRKALEARAKCVAPKKRISQS